MKNNQRLKNFGVRLMALILVFALFPADVFAGSSDGDGTGQPASDVKAYLIPTMDSTNGFRKNKVIYLSGDNYYMDIKDICDLTRSSSSLNGNVLSIVQGIYRAEIDLDKGKYMDNFLNSWNYQPLIVGDKVCVDAVAFLTLFGAECELDGNVLSVTMPNYTFWEAIDPQTFDYTITQDELFGGKAAKNISLVCDVLMDMLYENPLDVVVGNFARRTLYDLLDKDIMNYESAQNESVNIVARTSNACDHTDLNELSKELAEETSQAQQSKEDLQDVFDDLDDITGYTVTITGAASDRVVEYAKKVINAAEKNYDKASRKLARNHKLHDRTKKKLEKKINEAVSQKKQAKGWKTKANVVKYGIWVFKFTTNALSLSNQVNHFSEDSLYLLGDALGEDNIKYAGLNPDDFQTYKTVKRVSDLVEAQGMDQALDVGADAFNTTLAEFVSDFASEKAMEAITKDNIAGLALSVSTAITSLIFADEINAYQCDMMAAYDCILETEAAGVAIMLDQRAQKEHYCNTETMERLVDAEKLFYRSLIGVYANYKVSVEEFGVTNKAAWMAYFDKHCEYYAKMAFRLTNCECTGLFDPSGFKDDVLKGKLNTDALELAPETALSPSSDEELTPEYPTTYDENMDYSPVCACDDRYEYYKSTDGKLMRDNRDGSAGRLCLFSEEFITVCGIDASFIYLQRKAESGSGFDIEAVEKNGQIRRVILRNAESIQLMDGDYFFFTRADRKNVIRRVSRKTLNEEDFAVFNEDVELMIKQKKGYYVLTKSESLFSFFFGNDVRNYYINNKGKITQNLGESPAPADLPSNSLDSDFMRVRYVNYGYLRSGAADVYYKLSDGQFIATEHVSGWKNMDDKGIVVTLNNRKDNSKYPYEIAIYQGGKSDPKHIVDVWSDQAMFTLCKASDSAYYFFDQHDDVLSLNEVKGGKKTVLKEFNSSQINCDLNQCSATIQLDRVYFYTMTSKDDATVLYRYNVGIWEKDQLSGQ